MSACSGACQFFLAKRRGDRCGHPTACGELFCPHHCKQVKQSPAPSLHHVLLENAPPSFKTPGDIYTLCSNYWSKDPQPSDSQPILMDALDRLFTVQELRKYIRQIPVPPTPTPTAASSRKPALLRTLVSACLGFWKGYQQNPQMVSAAIRIQYYWRRFRKRRPSTALSSVLHGPYPAEAAHNDTDPFTFDYLTDIPLNELFSYKDRHESVYAFRASELAHYLGIRVDQAAPAHSLSRSLSRSPSLLEVSSNALNPYTREPIPLGDLYRLKRVLAALPPKDHENLEQLWQTARDAYTYTLHFYEKEGFYCDIDTFTTLTCDDIVRVFLFFHENTEDATVSDGLMNVQDCYNVLASSMEDPRHMHFAFCRQLLGLIRSSREDKFYLICNIFLALATVQRRISRSLPRWVFLGASMRGRR